MLLLILASLAATVACKPSFIAVPADQIAFVDLSRLHIRRPRQILTPPPPHPPLSYHGYQPIPLHQLQQQPIDLTPPPPQPINAAGLGPSRLAPIQINPASLVPPRLDPVEEPEDNSEAESHYGDRPPDFGEYVDFGAHTGDNGAFGWYADYPINNHNSNF